MPAQHKSERTRQYILEQVAPIFNKKGFAGTSLSDMMTATGLSKGAIYGHFKSKDELAAEAFRYNFEYVFDLFIQMASRAHTPYEKLMAFPRFFRRFYPRIIRLGGSPLLNAAMDSDDTNPRLHQMTRMKIERVVQTFCSWLEEAMAKKQIPQADPNIFAEVIFSMLQGSLMLSKVTGKRSYFDQTASRVEEMIDALFGK